VECSVVVCATFTLLVGLAWKKAIAAAAIAAVFVVLVWVIAAIGTTPRSLLQPGEYLLALVTIGPALAGLLISIAMVRSAGYRLRT
jgi:hypothetical protein